MGAKSTDRTDPVLHAKALLLSLEHELSALREERRVVSESLAADSANTSGRARESRHAARAAQTRATARAADTQRRTRKAQR